jgi:hypothetical protein
MAALIGLVAGLAGAGLLSQLRSPSADEDGIGPDDRDTIPNRVGVDRPLDWLVIATDQEGLIRVDPASGVVIDLGIEVRSLGRVWGKVIVQDIEGKVYALEPELLAQQPPIALPPPINDVLYAFLPSWVSTSSTPNHLWLSPRLGGATDGYGSTTARCATWRPVRGWRCTVSSSMLSGMAGPTSLRTDR